MQNTVEKTMETENNVIILDSKAIRARDIMDAMPETGGYVLVLFQLIYLK